MLLLPEPEVTSNTFAKSRTGKETSEGGESVNKKESTSESLNSAKPSSAKCC